MAPRAASRGRGGTSRGHGHGNQTQGEAATSSTPRIQWEGKEYTYRTNLLVAFCKDNPDLRLKLFSDSTQDAIRQGRTRKQMSASKDSYYQQIAQHIFTNDRDPVVRQAYSADPLSFVKTIKGRFAKLKTKYNTFNKELGYSGAGITVEQMLEDPNKRNLLGMTVIPPYI
ncbi:hypothetical protein JVT61DRAFT_9829 [Boletus reticuloceps]|uniref:Uncharacterized protein n=1 Tax=Boletus reticuloceps TaxID=495285 RepID=A0A8I2YG23_9AGAM|nr:hypothetical protein JVT61DRAFT_9829 [Boletus reticuloceps]